jgi:hypothetical protein
MESSWTAHGLLMESLWSAHGVFMECSWSLCGVLMESVECSWSPWSTHGLHEHSDMFGKIYLVGV